MSKENLLIFIFGSYSKVDICKRILCICIKCSRKEFYNG